MRLVRRNSRIDPVRLAALSLWASSLALMILGSVIDPTDNSVIRAWALWIQMCAWGFTAWWIVDSVARRDRLRVTELAEIMARVAMEGREENPRHAKLTRVH